MDFDNAEVIIFWNNTLNDQIFLFQGRCVVALWKGHRIPSLGAVRITQQIKSSIMRIDTAAVLFAAKGKNHLPMRYSAHTGLAQNGIVLRARRNHADSLDADRRSSAVQL